MAGATVVILGAYKYMNPESLQNCGYSLEARRISMPPPGFLL